MPGFSTIVTKTGLSPSSDFKLLPDPIPRSELEYEILNT